MENTEVSSIIDHPDFPTADKVLCCIEKINEHVLSNLSFEHFENGRFQIRIPQTVHSLLASRFDEQLNEYSRFRVFDVLRSCVAGNVCNDDFMEKLQCKIGSIVGTDVMISQLRLFDDEFMTVTVARNYHDETQSKEIIFPEQITLEINLVVQDLSEKLSIIN